MQDKPLQSITSKLIRRTLAWVMLCVLGFGAIQAWRTYHAIEKDFQLAVQYAAETHVPLISLAIWDIEPQAIERQIKLLLQSPRVGYVSVRASTGQHFEGGQAGIISRSAVLKFDILRPGKTIGSIGSLAITANDHALYQELLQSVGVVLLQCLLQTALILGMVVAILRRDLERPMRRLSAFVTSLQADHLNEPLALERAPGHARDELDQMAEGFATLQAHVHSHITSLDAQVLNRTRQLEQALSSLKIQSALDVLTGCFNRMLFNERFPAEMIRAQRYGRPLSVIFCDLDHFKTVNDTHGHLTGDRILSAMGACLRRELRTDIDWVTRYGGEEFVVVMPETPLAAACDIAERLRRDVMELVTVPLGDAPPLHVTASFGVAQQRSGESMEALVQRADEWLYAAKAGGRNQVQPALPTQRIEPFQSAAMPERH